MTREMLKITVRLFADTITEIDKMSHGSLYRSQYQILMRDILDEALKDKKLIARVMKKKEAIQNAN